MFLSLIFLILLLFYSSYGESFEQVLNEGLKKSFLLKEEIYKIKSLEGKVLSSSALNNPEISVEFGRVISQTENGVVLTAFSIQQKLRLWNEREYAKRAAILNKKAQEFLYKSFVNRFTGNVYKRFFSALYRKKLIELKKQELDLLKGLHSYIQKSYELGESIPLDLLQIEKDIQIVSLQLQKLKIEYKNSLRSLSAYTGVKMKDVEGNFEELPKIRDSDIKNLPVFSFISYMKKSIDNMMKRQKALGKPQISFGFVSEEDPVETGKYEFGFSVSSTVPVFYKKQGEILSLIYRKKALLMKEKQLFLNIKTSLENVKKNFELLKKQILDIDKKGIVKIKKALNLAQESYRLGALSFFELSSIRKQYFETLSFKYRLLNEAHQIYGDYLSISGLKGGLK